MKTENKTRKMVLSAMFIALAYVLPFLTGQIPEIGNMLCPMHIPALLCGYVCGGPWGLAVGFIAPLLRSFTLGMPSLFPKAVCMAVELATYGAVAGLMYRKLPKNNVSIYISLIIAMVVGRLVWGVTMFACMGFDLSKFGLSLFWAEAFTKAIPGIIVQLAFIPLIVMVLNKKSQ
ncbi:MAG: ECF transporter S component [Clostridia bacterium]|nr:ECF transporter S component [Clostridia bacterium]